MMEWVRKGPAGPPLCSRLLESLAGIQLPHGVTLLPCWAQLLGLLGVRLSWTGDHVPVGGGLILIGLLMEAQGSWQVFQ